MLRATAFCLVIICMLFSCAEVKKTHQPRPLPNAIPALHITGDTTATALTITLLDIKTVVAANIATTTFEVHFYNPNDRILEGEFEFPLADGQQVTRYALDMNGTLREGVVVEKAKARIAFESTVRKGIDPGLVEKTKGNNFRTRIYPLPAKGYRKIVIAIEQTLEQEDKDLFYQLPLYTKYPIDTFAMHISVLGPVKPQLDENGIPLQFSQQKNSYVAELNEKKFIANKTVAFSLPGSKEPADMILTENHEGQTYFYVNSRIEPEHKSKKKPATIGLFWDISSSGQKRDLKKETTLLKEYLEKLGNVSVSLIPFNIYTQAKENFTLSGNADKLIKRIESLNYDGGTQFGAVDLSAYSFDEVLLFSDGLSTFGEEDIIIGKSPVVTITTSPSANYSYLKFIAQQSRGSFIDLGKLETAMALKELDGESLQIINITYSETEIEGLVTQTTPVLNTGLSFSGKLKTSSADITIELGFGKDVKVTKKYTITNNGGNAYDAVKRIWASMTVNRLDMEYEKNKEAITALGKEFSIVTQNTSLIVLDRVEDYVEHEIIPPAELQNEYYALLKEKKTGEEEKTKTAFTEAVEAMANLKQWWKKNFTIHKPATTVQDEMITFTPPAIARDEEVEVDSLSITSGTGSSDSASPSVTTAVPFLRTDSAVGDQLELSTDSGRGLGLGLVGYVSDTVYYRVNADATYLAAPLNVSANYFTTTTNGNGVPDRFDEKKSSVIEPAIELSKWKPDVEYLKTLEHTSSDERWGKYLSLKKQYINQPSFFVDAARFFIEKNEKQRGIQILSNVSEMKLEDAALLRIVANELLEAGETTLAIETFSQLLKMREEEPQSYRDLALAYNETGEYNKAVELLYQLVLGTWDSRFGDVKSIALNEMNAIISAHKASVNIAGIDPKFIYAMPVDVRIVIGWNADNSDVDLWVTDPRKEKCFYSHNETEIGGKISKDVVQGYGPEEFLLKKAKKGNYIVDVNLYGDHRQTMGGPIAIKAELFTDYGRSTQKRKTINLRVTSDKEVINLGSLKFGS